jgi:hypothetical protein
MAWNSVDIVYNETITRLQRFKSRYSVMWPYSKKKTYLYDEDFLRLLLVLIQNVSVLCYMLRSTPSHLISGLSVIFKQQNIMIIFQIFFSSFFSTFSVVCWSKWKEIQKVRNCLYFVSTVTSIAIMSYVYIKRIWRKIASTQFPMPSSSTFLYTYYYSVYRRKRSNQKEQHWKKFRNMSTNSC